MGVQKVFELRRIGTVKKTFITEPDSLGRIGYGFIEPAWPPGLVVFFNIKHVELSSAICEGNHVQYDIRSHWRKGKFQGIQAIDVHVVERATFEEVHSNPLIDTVSAVESSGEETSDEELSPEEESSDSFGSSGSWSSSN